MGDDKLANRDYPITFSNLQLLASRTIQLLLAEAWEQEKGGDTARALS